MPIKTDANGRPRPDWTALLSLVLTAGISIVGAVFFLGNRLETPQVKTQRIDVRIAPIWRELDELHEQITRLNHILDSHRETGGHQEMLARMRWVEQAVRDVDKQQQEQLDLLRDVRATLKARD